MTAAAIDFLEARDESYYLLVEGGRIDHGHHDGYPGYALLETQAFAEAVSIALDKVDLEETLILVTADHSHVFTIGGYPRPRPETGVYAVTQALIPFARTKIDGSISDSETHAGEDVPLYAIGPGSERVGGVIEQDRIFDIMGRVSLHQALPGAMTI